MKPTIVLTLAFAAFPAVAETDPAPLEACIVRAVQEGATTRTAQEIRTDCIRALEAARDDGPMAACIAREVQQGAPGRSAAEIREFCSTTVDASSPGRARPSAVEVRGMAEVAVEGRPFILTAYQPSYFMATYNDSFDANNTLFAELDSDFLDFQKEEIKYQVSAKAMIARNLFGSEVSLFAAYTQTAWWQLFADQGITSAPFRDINHEPELFLRRRGGPALPFGGRIVNTDLALVHESNGRSEFLSRSWNRVMGRFTADYGDLAFIGRLWYRLPEDEEDDGNPDIEDFLGYGDLRAIWAPNRHTFALMVRPGKEEFGSELTWSYPVTKTLRVYAQWWYGHGENLLDYDQEVNRFGIGVVLNDFLMRDGPQ
ncbi:MAG: phospholipase A [Pseudomonadales bacterium]|nr:phospholipase A [Pseudomonadales bacterium]